MPDSRTPDSQIPDSRSPDSRPPGSRSLDAASTSQVIWPEPYRPSYSAVFVHNEIVIPAPPEQVWRWLVRAEHWPSWYTNSADIHFLSHTGPDLRDRSRFRWKTFGARITSKVLEFEPNRRLAWDAHGLGIAAYHAWILTPHGTAGTHVLTEETQNGWRARLGNLLMPKRLHTMHQLWLESLSLEAQSGPPPEA